MVAVGGDVMSRTADVLVVGAGPTGLTLALQAHALGARVKIIDRRPDAWRPSRALILHPRTLEVLRPLGVTEAILDRADTAPEVHLRLGSRMVRVSLAGFALPDTPFPHLTLVRQTDVEEVLDRALAARGVVVERGTELVDLEHGPSRVRATLRSPAGLQHVDCTFVPGCDGPESTVRRLAGIGWQGKPYAEDVVIADAELDADLTPGVAHVAAGRGGLVFVFALGERATWRILATRPAGRDPIPYGQPGPPISRSELQALLDAAGLDARITSLAWSARYALQLRLASRFRQGRLFLAGDAAHTSSPGGGQGMNAGIQDAVNLGWKLACAAASDDPATLLDSYDLERRPVVRQILRMTHLIFWAEAATGPLPSLLRGVFAPLGAPLIPAILGRRRLVAQGVRLVSQLRVAYPGSPLSVEGSPALPGGPSAGRRLPDATVTTADGQHTRLHALLAQPGFHVLLHRDAAPIEHTSFGPHVAVHRLSSIPGTGMVVVRPDGYIGLRCGIADSAQLRSWLTLAGAGTPALTATSDERS